MPALLNPRNIKMKLSARKLLIGLLVAAVTIGLMVGYLLLRQFEFEKLRDEYKERTPGELIRFARLNLIGHDYLEAVLLRPLRYLETRVERPVPDTQLPSKGKGQQLHSQGNVQYLASGQPIPGLLATTPNGHDDGPANIRVASSEAIAQALRTAHAGQTILIAPGRYLIKAKISTGFGGERDLPITLRAGKPGLVRLDFNTVEGFKVEHPFWIFENLHIRGVCEPAGDCEHAFHVVGKASSVVLRNNLIEDFNAHIKVNGEDGNWPDNGLVQFNTLSNSRTRDTGRPVTPIDIVAASKWRVADNIISNFAKSGGNQIAYGVFMKGAGHGGRIERNLIVCTPRDISQPGVRVGLSFGGGTSSPGACRDQSCQYEHSAGQAINNIIAHCNDFGIDVNRATSTLIAHNTLINTAGIDIRGNESTATVYANLLEGRIRLRDGSQAKLSMNETTDLRPIFQNADALDLRWRTAVETVPSTPLVSDDFCAAPRTVGTPPGALNPAPTCLSSVNHGGSP